MEEERDRKIKQDLDLKIKAALALGQMCPNVVNKAALATLADFQSNPRTKEAMHRRYLGNKALTSGDYKTAYCEYSMGIVNNPDDPALWCNRSLAYLKLGHPELTVVDSKRAIEVMDKYIDDSRNKKPGLKMPLITKDNDGLTLGQKLSQLRLKANFRASQALANLELFPDAIDSCEWLLGVIDQVKGVPFNWTDVRKLLEECKKRLEDGRKKHGPNYVDRVENYGKYTFRGKYWWDARQENRMSEGIFQNLARKISEISSKVKVAKVTFEEWGNEYHYGIKATSNISENTLILEEVPFLCVNSGFTKRCDYCNYEVKKKVKYICPKTGCKETYCNIQCYQQAYNLYHKVMCGKDFSEIYKIVKTGVSTSSLSHLFAIKLFAIGKNRDICPLDIEEIKHLRRWANAYSTMPVVFFKFYKIIIKNLEIPIGDLRFDFWVYISCMSTLGNNLFGDKDNQSRPDTSVLLPLISLINHDCEPNAHPTVELNNRKWGLEAKRNIKKGEPITVSYVNWPNMDDEERCKRLFIQHGIKCKCKKCSPFSKLIESYEKSEGVVANT
ncbi:4485_t:CDS:2 [Ambispora gerdemannii]|uniref:4485_t:CDS:1 n=1 Tax=Ambispora gerdemannii TaxID=144530 RepID=A0A9N9A3L0_9GLOM|nr:4485_t:CDS:2 [Ambispora gerdemannii]